MIHDYALAVQIGLALCGVALIGSIAPVHGGRSTRPLGVLPTLTGLALSAPVAVLAATAFTATLTGEPMRGWALLAHVSAGGATCVMLALAALTWLRPALRRDAHRRLDALGRLAASVTLALGIGAGASILASTFPLVGTAGLERLLDLHRWSGLGFAVMVAFTATRAIRARRARHAAGQSHAKVAPVTRP